MSMKGSTLMQESTKVAGVFGNQRDCLLYTSDAADE